MTKAPFIVLVNPWIADFAAYDLWARPLGLLYLASLLREGGCKVALVDCLDHDDPLTLREENVLPPVHRRFGTGKYARMVIPKPEIFREVPRYYYRHGIHPESLLARLQSLPTPRLILVTSIMTYWYPGVRETIQAVREVFTETPVWLGGIYARLCPDHARKNTGATRVVTNSPGSLPTLIESATGFPLTNKASWSRFDHWPPPALDLLKHPRFAPILTSIGCPFACPYCATAKLQPAWARRSAESILRDIRTLHLERGIVDFAFYDDALLMNADGTLKLALEKLCREKITVRFHTPNAIHARAVTAEWAQLLHASGFKTIRLGLETTRPDHQRNWGGKVDNSLFHSAVSRLLSAGFRADQVGVYLLAGLPGQTPAEVAQAIETVRGAGAMPYLSEYSPVPGTAMWKEAVAACRYDLEDEPLFHNNSFFACRRPDFTVEDLMNLKDLARCARRSLADRDGRNGGYAKAGRY